MSKASSICRDIEGLSATKCPRANFWDMSRYYFHVFNDETVLDEEGAEFLTPQAAHENAVRAARTMAAQSIIEFGHLVLHHRIEIERPNGQSAGTVHFRDVVTIEP